MELPRSGDYRFTFHSSFVGNSKKVRAYVLQILQPVAETQPPRNASKYDLPGEFRSKLEAYNEGVKVARRLALGELSPTFVRLKHKFREYAFFGSASFRLDCHQWEPALEIVSNRAANKGARQQFTFQSNLFLDADRAAQFALQCGERLVIGMIGGLTI